MEETDHGRIDPNRKTLSDTQKYIIEQIMIEQITDQYKGPDLDTWIRVKITASQTFAQMDIKPESTLEQMVPPEYHEYLDIFDKKTSDCMPTSCKQDHKIELKPGFEPKAFKQYSLTEAEKWALDEFLDDNLQKGYIKQFELPMASPFFFINKKDRKLRPCQDY